tara:strand:+ start:1715 stop:1906 length:192 start_codon:yes stop_codon:yes gene_type:complete
MGGGVVVEPIDMKASFRKFDCDGRPMNNQLATRDDWDFLFDPAQHIKLMTTLLCVNESPIHTL